MLHLPANYTVEDAKKAAAGALKNSTLTAFFAYNADNEDGRHLLYQQFPEFYTFNEARNQWHSKESGFSIRRVYTCSPAARERYYLKLLLTVVKGPKSFEDLYQHNGQEFETYKAACISRELINDKKA